MPPIRHVAVRGFALTSTLRSIRYHVPAAAVVAATAAVLAPKASSSLLVAALYRRFAALPELTPTVASCATLAVGSASRYTPKRLTSTEPDTVLVTVAAPPDD